MEAPSKVKQRKKISAIIFAIVQEFKSLKGKKRFVNTVIPVWLCAKADGILQAVSFLMRTFLAE